MLEKGGVGMPQLSLVKIDVRLDTGKMLDSMVEQARMVVFKAVAKATSATEELQADPPSGVDMLEKLDLGSPSATAVLSGFSSAVNISNPPPGPHKPTHRSQKAQSSLLKINSVLQSGEGKQNGNLGRKTKNIQWDVLMDLPKVKPQTTPSPKRQRVTNTANRLTSFKSFGRPHAGDFGSGPRNATFGDFGRKPIWGRDGRLANHPTPINQADLNRDPFSSDRPLSGQNATFNFQRPSIHLSPGLDLGISKKKKPDMNRVPSTIQRTPTDLEEWLKERTSGKK